MHHLEHGKGEVPSEIPMILNSHGSRRFEVRSPVIFDLSPFVRGSLRGSAGAHSCERKGAYLKEQKSKRAIAPVALCVIF